MTAFHKQQTSICLPSITERILVHNTTRHTQPLRISFRHKQGLAKVKLTLPYGQHEIVVPRTIRKRDAPLFLSPMQDENNSIIDMPTMMRMQCHTPLGSEVVVLVNQYTDYFISREGQQSQMPPNQDTYGTPLSAFPDI